MRSSGSLLLLLHHQKFFVERQLLLFFVYNLLLSFYKEKWNQAVIHILSKTGGRKKTNVRIELAFFCFSALTLLLWFFPGLQHHNLLFCLTQFFLLLSLKKQLLLFSPLWSILSLVSLFFLFSFLDSMFLWFWFTLSLSLLLVLLLENSMHSSWCFLFSCWWLLHQWRRENRVTDNTSSRRLDCKNFPNWSTIQLKWKHEMKEGRKHALLG